MKLFQWNKIFCCKQMENLIDMAGSRGMAAVVRKLSGIPAFAIQSRGIAHGDEGKALRGELSVTVNISSEIGILYCPFCGTRLQDVIDRNTEAIEALAERHAAFVDQS